MTEMPDAGRCDFWVQSFYFSGMEIETHFHFVKGKMMHNHKWILKDVPKTMLLPRRDRTKERKFWGGCFIDWKLVVINNFSTYGFSGSFRLSHKTHRIFAVIDNFYLKKFIFNHNGTVIVHLIEWFMAQCDRIKTSPFVLWVSVELSDSIDFLEHFIQLDVMHLDIQKTMSGEGGA